MYGEVNQAQVKNTHHVIDVELGLCGPAAVGLRVPDNRENLKPQFGHSAADLTQISMTVPSSVMKTKRHGTAVTALAGRERQRGRVPRAKNPYQK